MTYQRFEWSFRQGYYKNYEDMKLIEAPSRGVLWEKAFLQISQNSQENT